MKQYAICDVSQAVTTSPAPVSILMANIGSAFLGDLQAKRIRHLSSPPPSPTLENIHRMNVPLPPSRSQQDEQLGKAWAVLVQPPHKATIDPVLALELRVRWLEVLVLGVAGLDTSVNVADKSKSRNGDEKRQRGRGNTGSRQGPGPEKDKEKGRDKGKGAQSTETLARLTENVTKRLKAIVETNEGLRKFMDTCAFSITLLSLYSTMLQTISMHSISLLHLPFQELLMYHYPQRQHQIIQKARA